MTRGKRRNEKREIKTEEKQTKQMERQNIFNLKVRRNGERKIVLSEVKRKKE